MFAAFTQFAKETPEALAEYLSYASEGSKEKALARVAERIRKAVEFVDAGGARLRLLHHVRSAFTPMRALPFLVESEIQKLRGNATSE